MTTSPKIAAILFHAENTRNSLFYKRNGEIYNRDAALKAVIDGQYLPVAVFDIHTLDTENELENIYMKTQNFDKPWRPVKPTRSTSVGDIVRIGNDLYIVASCGFEKL